MQTPLYAAYAKSSVFTPKLTTTERGLQTNGCIENVYWKSSNKNDSQNCIETTINEDTPQNTQRPLIHPVYNENPPPH